MARYFGYDANSHFSYWTYDDNTVYSSNRSYSYKDEYDWFVDACEEYNCEPEYYED